MTALVDVLFDSASLLYLSLGQGVETTKLVIFQNLLWSMPGFYYVSQKYFWKLLQW